MDITSFKEMIDAEPGEPILAPLTKGGNLPFRRLCADFGARVTISEMAYARFLLKGEGRELALLRSHPSEELFGVQLAALQPEEGVKAAELAVGRGAKFIDINCGCPIDDTTRRGLGAALLRRPKALARLVESLTRAVSVPVTVKIRLGWSESDINVHEIAELAEQSGAAALTVHGRTREQRYTKAANWDLIGEVASKRSIPVIGNGDILTWYECEDRRKSSGIRSVMIGRAALIKPWLFKEIRTGQSFEPTAKERLDIYFRLSRHQRDHFREDEKGIRRALEFLAWHFNFFHRYRPLPESQFRELSRSHPLIQTRTQDLETGDADELEQLLRSPDPARHRALAESLLRAETFEEALNGANSQARELTLNPGIQPAEVADEELTRVTG